MAWSQTEPAQLLRPLGRGIAKRCDTDTAGQAAFDGCADKFRCEECQRDRQIDLPDAAALLGSEGLNSRVAKLL
ncbi:MAG: hypothetical protein NVS1B6_17160 [Steroidobacteraceae bacterium]